MERLFYGFGRSHDVALVVCGACAGAALLALNNLGWPWSENEGPRLQ